jgi:phosphate/sulfate permease
MCYNRILRVWVIDPLDYFLISAIIGSILASHLKNYLSEKSSMERLKKSIINKSNSLPSKTKIPIWSPTEAKLKRIYRVALGSRGGQFDPPVDELQAAHEFSNEIFNLAQQIKKNS